ncbi:hypothetical protein SS50377_24660 [Spironucleus salmonicida]|uniref:Transmembrane protein n=1 Tax=Spironucleus salmonicida TaxID=348837 RepID=A0A9P8LQB2_9EUKA|nr:hypothetical protein SS50377_24660 [Spironucleus salmonicida]
MSQILSSNEPPLIAFISSDFKALQQIVQLLIKKQLNQTPAIYTQLNQNHIFHQSLHFIERYTYQSQDFYNNQFYEQSFEPTFIFANTLPKIAVQNIQKLIFLTPRLDQTLLLELNTNINKLIICQDFQVFKYQNIQVINLLNIQFEIQQIVFQCLQDQQINQKIIQQNISRFKHLQKKFRLILRRFYWFGQLLIILGIILVGISLKGCRIQMMNQYVIIEGAKWQIVSSFIILLGYCFSLIFKQ